MQSVVLDSPRAKTNRMNRRLVQLSAVYGKCQTQLSSESSTQNTLATVTQNSCFEVWMCASRFADARAESVVC